MTIQERILAIIQSNIALGDEGKKMEFCNMVVYDIAKVAIEAVYTAGAAGNVTCKTAIVKIERLLKDSR